MGVVGVDLYHAKNVVEFKGHLKDGIEVIGLLKPDLESLKLENADNDDFICELNGILAAINLLETVLKTITYENCPVNSPSIEVCINSLDGWLDAIIERSEEQNCGTTIYHQSFDSEFMQLTNELSDGLYRDRKSFVWGGIQYMELTENMMGALDVLFAAHKRNRDNRVYKEEMERKIGSIPIDGFPRVFRMQRKNSKSSTHPVRRIVAGHGARGWYLRDPQLKT